MHINKITSMDAHRKRQVISFWHPKNNLLTMRFDLWISFNTFDCIAYWTVASKRFWPESGGNGLYVKSSPENMIQSSEFFFFFNSASRCTSYKMYLVISHIDTGKSLLSSVCGSLWEHKAKGKCECWYTIIIAYSVMYMCKQEHV